MIHYSEIFQVIAVGFASGFLAGLLVFFVVYGISAAVSIYKKLF